MPHHSHFSMALRTFRYVSAAKSSYPHKDFFYFLTLLTLLIPKWTEHLGKVLLCNACGIRWKRKNQTAGRRKLKPGPKRMRQLGMLSSISKSEPCTLQPSLASTFRSSNTKSLINKNLFSSSATGIKAEPYLQAEFDWFNKGFYHRTLPPCRKMDLGQLLLPTEVPVKKRLYTDCGDKTGSKTKFSPISINNLLNYADDETTVCSSIGEYQH